jgi:hypothetical protein
VTDTSFKSTTDELKKLIQDGAPQSEIDKKIEEIKTILENTDSLAGKIDILDNDCNVERTNCKKSDLQDSNGVYDFSGDIKSTSDS